MTKIINNNYFVIFKQIPIMEIAKESNYPLVNMNWVQFDRKKQYAETYILPSYNVYYLVIILNIVNNAIIKIFTTFYLNHISNINVILSWRQEKYNCCQLTLKLEQMEKEDMHVVFSVKSYSIWVRWLKNFVPKRKVLFLQ